MVHTSRPLRSVKEPTVGWLELFYDLTMVATVVVFSIASTRSPDLLHVAWFVGAFALVWWAWLCATLTMNVHRKAGGTAQWLIVRQMMAMIYMAALLADPAQSQDHFILPLYGIVMVLIAALNEWLRRHEATRPLSSGRRNAFAVSCRLGGPEPVTTPHSQRFGLLPLELHDEQRAFLLDHHLAR